MSSMPGLFFASNPKGCVYTAQGEVVCGAGGKAGGFVEGFVEEKQNIAAPGKVDNIVNSAINGGYCDVSVAIDPQTGEAKYSLKKECK